MWVLMIFMLGSTGYYSQQNPAGFTQEFTTQARCETAGQRYTSIHVGDYKPAPIYFCVPK